MNVIVNISFIVLIIALAFYWPSVLWFKYIMVNLSMKLKKGVNFDFFRTKEMCDEAI